MYIVHRHIKYYFKYEVKLFKKKTREINHNILSLDMKNKSSYKKIGSIAFYQT